MKERQPCQAKEHAPGCPCPECKARQCQKCHKLTVDHITPKCIGKLLGWPHSRINDESNLQYLTRPCHAIKDKDTPAKKDRLKKRLKSGVLQEGIEEFI